MTIASKDISVVIQGAIDEKLTPKCLQSVRKYLPDAEVILSTWKGSEISSLEGLYDKLVLNVDPGASPMDYPLQLRPYNLNRYLVSSKNGIQISTKSYILKMRSDLCLRNTSFLKYFDKFSERNDRYSIFKHKVLTSSLYTISGESGTGKERGITHYTPYHISDWYHFGLSDDIKLLYSCKLVDMPNFASYIKKPDYPIKWLNHRMWKFPPEQYLGVELAKKKYPDLDFPDCLHYDRVDLEQAKRFIIDNFITLDYKQSGILMLKVADYADLKKMCKKFWKIPPHVFENMYSFEAYTHFYNCYYSHIHLGGVLKYLFKKIYYRYKRRKDL